VKQLAHTPGLSLTVSNINATEPHPTKDNRSSLELNFMGQFELGLDHKLLSREIAENSVTSQVAVFRSSFLVISQ
jgi:hypothetical protein